MCLSLCTADHTLHTLREQSHHSAKHRDNTGSAAVVIGVGPGGAELLPVVSRPGGPPFHRELSDGLQRCSVGDCAGSGEGPAGLFPMSHPPRASKPDSSNGVSGSRRREACEAR